MSLLRFIKYRKNIPVMRENDTVMDAIRQMIEQHSGVVLVASNGKTLDGLFTDRDVMIKITVPRLDPEKTTLDQVMTRGVITARDDTSLEDAIQLLVANRIRHLPVLNAAGELIGMISLRYLLHDRVKELIGELDRLEAYFNDAPGG